MEVEPDARDLGFEDLGRDCSVDLAAFVVVDLCLVTFFVVEVAVPDGRGGLKGFGAIVVDGWV